MFIVSNCILCQQLNDSRPVVLFVNLNRSQKMKSLTRNLQKSEDEESHQELSTCYAGCYIASLLAPFLQCHSPSPSMVHQDHLNVFLWETTTYHFMLLAGVMQDMVNDLNHAKFMEAMVSVY